MSSEFKTPADIIPRLVLLAAGESDSAKMLLIGEQLQTLLRRIAESDHLRDSLYLPDSYDIGQFLREHPDGAASAEIFVKGVMSIVYAEALEERKQTLNRPE